MTTPKPLPSCFAVHRLDGGCWEILSPDDDYGRPAWVRFARIASFDIEPFAIVMRGRISSKFYCLLPKQGYNYDALTIIDKALQLLSAVEYYMSNGRPITSPLGGFPHEKHGTQGHRMYDFEAALLRDLYRRAVP
jgi:hypothetical protein